MLLGPSDHECRIIKFYQSYQCMRCRSVLQCVRGVCVPHPVAGDLSRNSSVDWEFCWVTGWSWSALLGETGYVSSTRCSAVASESVAPVRESTIQLVVKFCTYVHIQYIYYTYIHTYIAHILYVRTYIHTHIVSTCIHTHIVYIYYTYIHTHTHTIHTVYTLLYIHTHIIHTAHIYYTYSIYIQMLLM